MEEQKWLLAAIIDSTDAKGNKQPGIKSLVEKFGDMPMTEKTRNKYYYPNLQLIIDQIVEMNKFRQSKIVAYPELFNKEWDDFREKRGDVLPETEAKIKELEQLKEAIGFSDIEKMTKTKAELEWILKHKFELGNDEQGNFRQILNDNSFNFDETNEEINAEFKHLKEVRWKNFYIITQENPYIKLPADELPEIVQYQKDVIQALKEVDEYLLQEVSIPFVKCYHSDMPQVYAPNQSYIINNPVIREIFLHPAADNKLINEKYVKNGKHLGKGGKIRNINGN